jgi:hypothetical protein
MRLSGYAAMFFVISSFGSVFGRVSLDPIWMYKDIVDTDRVYYSLAVHDTCRTHDFNLITETDTGDKYDSSYINIDYKFSPDSIYFIDPYSLPPYGNKPDTIYRDYRPGFAGFKIDWDGGAGGFPLAKYKYLIFAHKGPLPNHKVTIRFGYNANCGDATIFHTIGSVAASSAWKIDTIVIPDSVRNVSDSAAAVRHYYEMQALINNVNPADTNKSSARGCFKIDNINLAGMKSGVINRNLTVARTVSKMSFIPSTNGPVRISAFSLSGELLYCAKVDVVAGKKYTVGNFVRTHAPLSPSLIQCIKIKGAGIDILQKVWK